MKNVFNTTDTNEIIARINTLTPTTTAQWGKMDVAKMLAHCNVSYELVYDNIHPKLNFFMRFIIKTLVKPKVVNEEPYTKNGPTGAMFIVKSDKDFETEKARLIAYINKTQALGAAHFEGVESHGFGVLTSTQWNNMFYKHLNHHLAQFGA